MPRGRGARSKTAGAQGDVLPLTAADAASFFFGMTDTRAILLAVSGGPDSTALLWLAAQWRKRFRRGPKLIAITVDHGLRKEARAEALAVKKLAASLRITHATLRWSGRKPSTGIPAAARKARYGLLVKAARKYGAGYIVTAHTRDDQAETVLMRLVRGSGVSGLAGMHVGESLAIADKGPIALVRPLLGVPKSRLIATLKGADIAYADDPTNYDTSFTRARLRASMPILAGEGLTAERLALLAERVRRIEIAIYDTVTAVERRLIPGPWRKGDSIVIDVDAFTDLPEEIQLRLLGRAISRCATEGTVELGKLEALHGAVDGAIRNWWLKPEVAGRFRRTLAGAVVTVARGKLTIEAAPPRRSPPRRP
jgi:tRNA(Ile)-lysidine synthase